MQSHVVIKRWQENPRRVMIIELVPEERGLPQPGRGRLQDAWGLDATL